EPQGVASVLLELRARVSEAPEGHVHVPSARGEVDGDLARRDLLREAERRAEITREHRCREPVAAVVHEPDTLLERGGRGHREHGAEDLRRPELGADAHPVEKRRAKIVTPRERVTLRHLAAGDETRALG